jgi:hypothetical protein
MVGINMDFQDFASEYLVDLSKLSNIINEYVKYVRFNDSSLTVSEWYDEVNLKDVNVDENFSNVISFLNAIKDKESELNE